MKLIRKILRWYVNKERMYYDGYYSLKKGDLVTQNWKAKVFFDENYTEAHIVESVEYDNIVTLENGELWSAYWLKKFSVK